VRAKVVYLSIIIVGLLVSFGLARNLYTAYQNSKLLSDSQRKLQQLKLENESLQQESWQASDPSFIDQEARQRLGLVKPGEVLIILPHDTATTAATPTQKIVDEPVWKKWMSLFFGS